MQFQEYHFHIYFGPTSLSAAQEIVEKLQEFDYLDIGRVWNKPVGPHPIGSCQVTVKAAYFQKMCEWFLEHRNNLSIFIHAVTGDDLLDHTDYVMWIGDSYKINLAFFNK